MSESPTPQPRPTTISILSQASIHSAILGRINGDKFSDRNTYVGGSEVGGCLREVAWKKALPERAIITDPESAGRMLAGQFLENAIVQLVRDAFGGVVRETGRAQAELVHESAPLRSHPDGRLNWKVEWKEGMRIAYLDEKAREQFMHYMPQGQGTLEIKTANGSVYRKYLKEGLPHRYLDQTQVEMGLGKTAWTLLVLVNRENLAQFVSFLLFYDESRYEACVKRSHITMESVQRINEAVGAEFVDRDEAEAQHLPAAEPERGWCQYCDHQDKCPAYAYKDITFDPAARFPEDVAVEVEVMAEEYLETKPVADRNEVLKNKIKDKFLEFGVKESFGLFIQTSKGRTSIDSDRLETEKPDIYNEYLKVGNPSHALKIARAKKGAKEQA